MRRSEIPLRRVDINLYAEDVEWLEATYGHGWSETVRRWVNEEIQNEIRCKEYAQ